MADSAPFEIAAAELERLTPLERIEARGTLRLALKEVGLDGRSATGAQLRAVVERLLPRELEVRGVPNAQDVCAQLKDALAGVEDQGVGSSALDVFSRFGSR
jgi:hypothetical protein